MNETEVVSAEETTIPDDVLQLQQIIPKEN